MGEGLSDFRIAANTRQGFRLAAPPGTDVGSRERRAIQGCKAAINR